MDSNCDKCGEYLQTYPCGYCNGRFCEKCYTSEDGLCNDCFAKPHIEIRHKDGSFVRVELVKPWGSADETLGLGMSEEQMFKSKWGGG